MRDRGCCVSNMASMQINNRVILSPKDSYAVLVTIFRTTDISWRYSVIMINSHLTKVLLIQGSSLRTLINPLLSSAYTRMRCSYEIY